MLTPENIVIEAENWIGYREKDHASADLSDFYEDAGDGNYTIFSEICGHGIVSWQWCQLFVCGVFVIVCGSIRAAKKALYDTDGGDALTSYTPTGAQFFKNAGRWFTVPERGDVVYFYGRVSSEEGRKRICHTGIVEWVDRGSQTFGTIEGNSNFDGFTTNGGSVARHEYSYAEVGGDARVNGFGRPAYDAKTDGVYIQIGG